MRYLSAESRCTARRSLSVASPEVSAEKDYYLIITKSEHSPEEFNKICNILSEYAANTKFVSGMEAYYAEHMDCVVEENALQKLAVLA